ncbi:hypothetical protein MGA3_07050 [Bacillus methanolicus MGA3]|uniref:Uncharacterized protein n=2 Tax=Bacillus methanolicus TaxID=1471 RepID=I3E8Z1_BACMM|nr:hypothetical protein BMMGA3_09125 [Bacillus methanolicus MGA3]EIJ82962.1 hypothetical protein MGA3_07050 [Bacillus methanolicus MGA3]
MMDYNYEILSLLDNSLEFEKLHSKFSRFNPFKILRVDQFEIRHSNVLSWLLNPNDNHNLGSFFVKKLLAKTFVKAENENLLGRYNLIQLHKHSFHDLEVYREVQTSNNKRIDILAVSELQKVVILIENKYKSSESDGQLNNYLSFVRQKYSGYTIIPIFLSLDSSVPTNKEYFILDYHDILDILKIYMDVNGDQIFHPIKEFINYYISILEDELIRDEEDIELALQIYKKHKDAIDFLYAVHNEKADKFISSEVLTQVAALSPEDKIAIDKIYLDHQETINFIYTVGNSIIREAFLEFVLQNEIPDNCWRDHIRVPSFIFPEWRQLDEILGVPKEEWWLNNAFIIWFERIWDNRLKLTVEVGPLDYEARLRLLNTLERKGVKIKEKSKEQGAMYTRIYTSAIKVENWADKKEIVEAMNRLYNKEDFYSICTAISGAIHEIVYGQNSDDEMIHTENTGEKEILAKSFEQFMKEQGIQEGCYNVHHRLPSFILPEFRVLEQSFGIPRWNWWLNNCLIMWFERLKDNRLKFTIEVGPLESDKRIEFLNRLEEKGIKINPRSKLPEASYTRIFSGTHEILDWTDEKEIITAMNNLYSNSECKKVILAINEIAEEITTLIR